MLMEKDPNSEHLKTERMQETLMEIQSRVLTKMGDYLNVNFDDPADADVSSDGDESVHNEGP